MDKVTDKSNVIDIRKRVKAAVKREKEKYEELLKDPNTFSSPDILAALNANEDGDAVLYINLHRNKFRYDHSVGKWFKWAGNYWEEDRIGDALSSVECVIEEYSKEASNQAAAKINATTAQKETDAGKAEKLEKKLLSRIQNLHSVHRKRNVLLLAAAGSDSLGITGDEWDLDPWLLGCKNGVIELKSGEFRPGRSEDYIKTVAPTEWKGLEIKAPTWEKFISEIFNENKELIDYVQRLLGYSITGVANEHILPILWGDGRNGKGTLLEVIFSVLGLCAGPIQAEMLLTQAKMKSSAGPSPDIMALRGRRIAWGSETDDERRLDAGKVKWLVGGDTLVGRPVYGKREIHFNPSHTLFLLTNHKPNVPGDDYALWDRIHLIPFMIKFVDEPKGKLERKRDRYLREKLINESSGILAWLVRGCLAWQKEGLNPPPIVKEATKKYQEDEDVIGQFLNDCCEQSMDKQIQASPFYESYKRWCESSGYPYVNGKTFGTRMTKRFTKVYEKGRNFYKGVTLINELIVP